MIYFNKADNRVSHLKLALLWGEPGNALGEHRPRSSVTGSCSGRTNVLAPALLLICKGSKRKPLRTRPYHLYLRGCLRLSFSKVYMYGKLKILILWSKSHSRFLTINWSQKILNALVSSLSNNWSSLKPNATMLFIVPYDISVFPQPSSFRSHWMLLWERGPIIFSVNPW